MGETAGHLLSVFLGFFAIMNPIANTPIFLSLTVADNPQITRRVARRAIFLTFAIILLFCLMGKALFDLFGITLPAFQITGGILVALIGYHMLHGDQSPVQNPSMEDNEDSLQTKLSVAISPLAVPILAGPGTIATAMNFASTKGNFELITTIIAFATLCAITYICFVFGQRLVHFLGQSGLNVITRLMGLILAVVGMQMLIEGIKGAFPSIA